MEGRGEYKSAVIAVVAFMLIASSGLAMGRPGASGARGTPEMVFGYVRMATDGTHPCLPGNLPNGIAYYWEQEEAFSPSHTVATFGLSYPGITIDSIGTWLYFTDHGDGEGDAGSIWDAWATNEKAVQIHEIFNDRSVSGRNYTAIKEDTMEGDGSTNFGGGANPGPPNIMTPINDPTLVDAWPSNSTAMITIATQTMGLEVPSLFDGYGVYKSTSPITQTNQGTALGDATLEGGAWVYRDTSFIESAYYAVKVKWDGGTYPFYAPLYSYGMSNDTFALYDPTPPVIAATMPADNQVPVNPSQPFTAYWSESMDTSKGYVDISPYCPGVWGWSGNDTQFTYTPTMWDWNTHYTLTFCNFEDLAGNPAQGDLVKEFETEVHPELFAPYGLTVSTDGSDVVLEWGIYGNIGPNSWNVYRSLDKFATFPSAWTMVTIPGTSLSWAHTGAANDGNTWYYMVEAEDGWPGLSSMGVKQHMAFTHNAYPKTNIMFITIPQDSGYTKASDIVMELEGALVGSGLDGKINVVGKWVPGDQASTAYLYDDIFEEWTGDDFAIAPGDGIYLSVKSNFAWVVCGVDTDSQLSFVHNAVPKTNIMFFNLPATCSYMSASSIVLELEGALTGPGLDSKINVIGLWIFPGQYSTCFLYDTDFEEWCGDDFAIAPGTGIYLSITSDFTWTPALITPVVP